MMKKPVRSIFLLLLFMCSISIYLTPYVHADEAKSVTVVGRGAVIGNDTARARGEALRDAYRWALEKAGVNISVSTETKNHFVIHDVVRANVEGFVKSWQIIDEGVRDDGLYYVTITAEVAKTAIKKDDRDALKLIIDLMGNPRFIVLVDETNIEKKPPFSTLEATLTEALTDCGFHSIDPEQKKSIEDRELLWPPDTPAAIELAMRMQVDVIIVGNVYTEKRSKNKYQSPGRVDSNAYSTVRAVIAETGKILDVISLQRPGAGNTYSDAGVDAIKRCGQAIADDLIWNIPLHIGANKEKTIQLLANNLTYSDYSRLTGELRNIRSVTSIFPRGWKKGDPAIYDIKTTGNTEDLAVRLETLGLEILRCNMNKIEVKRAEKGWWK